MPFDPTWPPGPVTIGSAKMREQFNGLKTLIDNVPAGPPGPQGGKGDKGDKGDPGDPGGGGDVTGPGSATDGAVAVFDGATGKTIRPLSPADLVNAFLSSLPASDPHDGTSFWLNNGVVTKSAPRTQQVYRFTGITSAGSGYQQGDIVTPATGEPVSSHPNIVIQSVDENGAVTAFNDGVGGTPYALYYEDAPPDGSTSGGSGTGFTTGIATGA